MAFIRYGTGKPVINNIIDSCPSDAEYRISNMYVDSTTGAVMISYSDETGGEDGAVLSEPPDGNYPITNAYVDENGRTWIIYDGNTT